MAILKTASFSCAIVCMAIVSAMNWNHIILQIPEHQLHRSRHHRGGNEGHRDSPSPLIHLLRRGEGQIADRSSSAEFPTGQSVEKLFQVKVGNRCSKVWRISITTFEIIIRHSQSTIISSVCCVSLITDVKWAPFKWIISSKYSMRITVWQQAITAGFYIPPHPRFSGAKLFPLKVWSQHIPLLTTHYLTTMKL